MVKKRILITGASGCIGHYISEVLIQDTNHELFLLVRNSKKLRVNTQSRTGINVLQVDMADITQLAELLKTIDIAILTATAWGGDNTYNINVNKTLELINLLDADKSERVIYFSTASVLGRDNQPLPEAGELGTDYISSKYDCLQKIKKIALANKITTVYPTLVLGGDENKPCSQVTMGIPEVVKYINIIRFLQADGSFHFIHGKDIATVVAYLIANPDQKKGTQKFVLGQNPLTANQAIESVCAYLGKKIYFRIPLSLSLANIIIVLFRIQMAAWDRFCMNYRHFTYNSFINPSSLDLPNYCATMEDVLKISGIRGKS
ncbi:MAG: NAD(P)-dependent oxidoreductase [Richelia sp.]|nr:NAD(P)-dependent oxidoreductase [Richelia sp.]